MLEHSFWLRHEVANRSTTSVATISRMLHARSQAWSSAVLRLQSQSSKASGRACLSYTHAGCEYSLRHITGDRIVGESRLSHSSRRVGWQREIMSSPSLQVAFEATPRHKQRREFRFTASAP